MGEEPPLVTVAKILAGKHADEQVRLRGWVHRSRSSGGKLAFVVLRDGTGAVQCTVKGGVADDASLGQAIRAKLEASVERLEGTVVADARAPGGFEVKVSRFALHEPPGPDGKPVPSGDFPLRGGQGTEFELDQRHLWLRSTELSAILRIKHRLYKAIRDFYDGEGFVEADPSVITTNACEGGSTLFTFDYFGQTAYLSQSAQMYLEGLIFGLPKVYSITPSFRAEKSRTTKHLTEFHHLEAEAAWWDAEENRRHQEKLVTHLAHTVARECEADLKLLGQDPARLLAVKAPFERIDYAEAVERLKGMGFHIAYGDDFGVPHEKALTEGRTSPIFICDWPAKIKAFYMAEKPGTDRVLCSDLLAPDGYGEVIGGSQRSEAIERMQRRLHEQMVQEFAEANGVAVNFLQMFTEEEFFALREQNPALADKVLRFLAGKCSAMDLKGWSLATGEPLQDIAAGRVAIPADRVMEAFKTFSNGCLRPYEWYFDLRRYGSVPHAGFGLGIERLLRWFTGQEHIRDMLPYPRTPARAYP